MMVIVAFSCVSSDIVFRLIIYLPAHKARYGKCHSVKGKNLLKRGAKSFLVFRRETKHFYRVATPEIEKKKKKKKKTSTVSLFDQKVLFSRDYCTF